MYKGEWQIIEVPTVSTGWMRKMKNFSNMCPIWWVALTNHQEICISS